MIRTELATAIGRAARRLGPHPRGLLFTPVARGNPFQELLHGGLWSRGIAPIPVYDATDISAARWFHDLGGRAALHLHWTTGITGRAETEADAAGAGKAFLDRVRELQHAGIRFVWTIHNRLPHECRFVEAELDFRAELAATADVIHLMSRAALDELTELYPIPADRVTVLAHPSYDAAYPGYMQRPDVRLRLGIDQDELVIAVIGAIRAYKQVDALHDAVRASRAPVRLLVAGEPGPDTEELVDSLHADPEVTVIARRLTDREVSEVIVAADAVASVYGSPLASGTATLALTLGRAVLAPDRRSAREQFGEAAIYGTTTDVQRLADVLGGLDRADLQRRGQLARELAAGRRAVPADFAARIDALLGRDGS